MPVLRTDAVSARSATLLSLATPDDRALGDGHPRRGRALRDRADRRRRAGERSAAVHARCRSRCSRWSCCSAARCSAPRLGAASQVLYLAAGIAGLPVFAASAVLPQGPARLLGPTGGYLMSYPLAAFVERLAGGARLRPPLPDLGRLDDGGPRGGLRRRRRLARRLHARERPPRRGARRRRCIRSCSPTSPRSASPPRVLPGLWRLTGLDRR